MAALESLSIVIPVFNDEEVLEELHGRLRPVVDKLAKTHEIIFIDDGSTDRSFAVLLELHTRDAHIKILKQSRNFGQANSIDAGLKYATGDVIILMDSDLQDRPEDIPKLLAALHERDSAMAIAKWVSRKDSFIKTSLSNLFFKVSGRITNLQHLPQLGVFRAIRKTAYDKVRDVPETTGSILSLLYWSGLSYVPVELHRDARFAGHSGYSLRRMLNLAADRVFSYSLFPIKVATGVGVFLGLLSIVLGVIFMVRKFVLMNVVPGWTSLIVLSLLLFGIGFILMGLIGEYLGRIYVEAKGRPKYITEVIVDSSLRTKEDRHA